MLKIKYATMQRKSPIIVGFYNALKLVQCTQNLLELAIAYRFKDN